MIDKPSFPRVRLGALELGAAGARQGPRAAIATVLELAETAEQVGLSRLWLAEHHTTSVAMATPELVLPLIGERTQRLRLGVGGVLLRLHRPFAVAQQFALLSRLYPGRIDLGIARGGADPITEIALLDGHFSDKDETRFERRVRRLVASLRGELPPPLVPSPGDLSMWLLGSTVVSAGIASRLGLPYCHALFLGTRPDPVPPGTAAVAVAGICAPTAQIANAHLRQQAHAFIRPSVVGEPEHCAQALRLLADRHGVDEVLFCDLCEDPVAHLDSYWLLARALDVSVTTT